MSRKQTRFKLCEVHAGWHRGSRQRLAEMFCEGGPGQGAPCSPQLCQVWPGRDLFAESATDEVAAQWVSDWTVNRASHDNDAAGS